MISETPPAGSEWLTILTTAIDQAFNAVVITDAVLDGGGPHILYANPAFCRMTGYAREELQGVSPRILQGERTDPAVIAELRQCLRDGRLFSGSTYNYRKDGSPYIVGWSISPIRNEAGLITHYVSLQQDITEKVKASEALERLAEALRRSRDDAIAILNSFPTATLIIEADGTLGFCSPNGASMLDLVVADSLGRPWDAVLPLEPAGRQALAKSLRTPEPERQRQTLACRGDAGPRWVSCWIKDDPRDADRRLVFLEDETELQRLRQQVETQRYAGLIGESEAMQMLYRQIGDVARGNWTVLIEGETGTGKELVARAIHKASPRRQGPFIAVNSAGLSESLMTSQLFGHRKGAITGAVTDHKGLFEAAAGGTIFLDEIGDMPLAIQAALLRVLQESEVTRVGETQARPIDVRVIAATHRHLVDEVAAGRFREDLLYRFRVARIQIPPLRQRKTDIPLLAMHFLQVAGTMAGKSLTGLSPGAMRRLLSHEWPGNVRELRAAMDFAAIYAHGPRLEAADLPPEIQTAGGSRPPGEVLGEAGTVADESARIQAALTHCRGNRTQAAHLLGMSRSTFYRRLRELQLDGND